ncbi:hypothetical protein EJ06DRAFT_475899 [Trichodelitschia bisporula]|uniref:DNA replication ATP-dependent helicase/nuclease n=1 Tax=Trichodelitschia bisporula TaxID=703511 RepID=A0A6G1HZD8_9PEZI|nr:hypothetical protein EJ06DRAFT_475899 [Trichodelitschia bisporula]
MALSNELIYDGQLKCGNDGVALRSLVLRSKDAALEQHHHPPSPPSQVPPSADEFICRAPTSSSCPLARALSPSTKVVFFNTDALLPTSAEILHKSRITNPLEASITVQLAHLLIDAGLAPHDLGVITFYRSQLALLRSGLRPLAGVELHTADKFQGRDKEAVVVSFVRSNDDAGVGELLRDWRRINVALTRARSKLVLIGSKKTLLQGGEVLKGMVGICERQGWMYDLRPGAEGAHYFPGVMGTQGSSWESPAKKSPLKRKAVQDPETSPTLRKARGQGATDQAKWKKVAASSEPALSQTDLLESSIRDVLGDIEGNSSPKDRKGLKAPAKKGTVGEKALRKNKVLQDVINDLTM